MSELAFSVVSVEPEPYSVSPILNVRLRIDDASGEQIHAMALRAQVRIEPQRRQHSEAEAEALADMFGPREPWSELIVAQFPGTGWLRLDHDVLAALAAYKASHGLTTNEAAVTDLLAKTREVVA